MAYVSKTYGPNKGKMKKTETKKTETKKTETKKTKTKKPTGKRYCNNGICLVFKKVI